ncbi:hypothetical protein G4H71_04655 [Rhodococcus triatomae]|uniref:Uncharacterized protein n=1 Tax=Rhodococcus triatomae TaxID=300028 RepID=A0A1G7ZXW3_9NOCA|nr:hypothetical protein [Rhodococcus triatomae]QNG17916.1 hypothetical protein G4H72_03390 [Rhodococcus triatomae]QNG22416.1 hypothetical protein G4H71_04655 [Rhodococcus triatomae]SDH13451.1 hypothetical protein SAMN05444695_101256 [Rhodococcus triatomae]
MLHNDVPGTDDITALATTVGPTCISIYTPTERATSNASEKNHTGFANQVREALEHVSDKHERAAFEEQFAGLLEDEEYWRYQSRTLAVFATTERLRTFRLPNRLLERTSVGDRFFVKPLLRAVTFPQSAFVLALAEGSVRVVEVSAEPPAQEVKITGLPTSTASFADDSPQSYRARLGGVQDVGKKTRVAEYARAIDHQLRSLLGARGVPLILASAEPTSSIYRSVNSYTGLLDEGIDGNPEHTSDDELASRSREVLDNFYKLQVADLAEQFDSRTSEGRTQTDLSDLAKSATFGAIDTLFVDIDAVVPGSIDPDDGTVSFGDEGGDVYGVVDEIARRTLLSSGRVLALRAEEVPGGGAAAAILRYAPTGG